MKDEPKIGAVILAAGASERMGTPKQLLEVGGSPLVLRAADAALASPLWPVVVVVGAHGEKVRAALARRPLLIVENSAWAEGMASSIRAGIGALEQFSRKLDGALLALCDQPAFSQEIVTRLLAAQRTGGRGIAAARYGGHNGAPAIFLRDYFAPLAALTGDEGARALLNGDPGRVTPVDLPELSVDLDTPADYDAFKSRPHA